MGIAKGNIAGGYALTLEIGGLDGYLGVGQARPADLFQVIEPANQAMFRFEEICHGVEGAEFTGLRPLAILDMYHGETIIEVGNGACHATVHAAAGKDNGEWLVRRLQFQVRGIFYVISHRFSIDLPPAQFRSTGFQHLAMMLKFQLRPKDEFFRFNFHVQNAESCLFLFCRLNPIAELSLPCRVVYTP
jgi:hypothetical protein